MREIIIFDQDDLVRLCLGAEVNHVMRDGRRFTYVSEQGHEKMLNDLDSSDNSINFSKMDIQVIREIFTKIINEIKGGLKDGRNDRRL